MFMVMTERDCYIKIWGDLFFCVEHYQPGIIRIIKTLDNGMVLGTLIWQR